MKQSTQTQQPATPVVRQDLNVRVLLLRAAGRKIDQRTIGEAIGKDQTYVCKAMKYPERHQSVAKAIEQYLDRLESPQQSTSSAIASHA